MREKSSILSFPYIIKRNFVAKMEIISHFVSCCLLYLFACFEFFVGFGSFAVVRCKNL